MKKRTRTMLTYLTMGALLYWWFNRQRQQPALTPDQIAYAKSLPSDLYL